jgi:hypothetical protein
MLGALQREMKVRKKVERKERDTGVGQQDMLFCI